MNRAELLQETRDVLNDAYVNGQFSDPALFRYLAEGQDKFCEQTGFFKDVTNFTLTLADATANYAIPDRVIEILNIWDGARRFSKIPTGSEVEYSTEWGYNPDLEGTPRYWQTDRETGLITLTPIPTAADAGTVLTMQVWRYSQYDFAADDIEPEIPARYHMAMVEWAVYKCFNRHDMEVQDPVKAADHLATFKEYVDDGITAMRRYHGEQTYVGTNSAYRT